MDNLIDVRGVDLVRDGRLLLDQITLSVAAGELWALLGPNGAGKGVLLRLLATYSHPTRGYVEILGNRLGRVDVFALRPLVSLVSTHHPVRSGRTTRELVLTGATGTLDLAARWAPAPAESARADDAIALMGLSELASSRWSVLSQGERSRALIARALMGSPRVLLLDEPTAGLDVAGREQLLEIGRAAWRGLEFRRVLFRSARWAPAPAESARADDAIALMGLSELASSRWSVLSQGERSRALIARALMGSPRVLLLDEPTAGLDVAGREQLL